jgi:hypothetical protein
VDQPIFACCVLLADQPLFGFSYRFTTNSGSANIRLLRAACCLLLILDQSILGFCILLIVDQPMFVLLLPNGQLLFIFLARLSVIIPLAGVQVVR